MVCWGGIGFGLFYQPDAGGCGWAFALTGTVSGLGGNEKTDQLCIRDSASGGTGQQREESGKRDLSDAHGSMMGDHLPPAVRGL